jgi:hypothetical protein
MPRFPACSENAGADAEGSASSDLARILAELEQRHTVGSAAHEPPRVTAARNVAAEAVFARNCAPVNSLQGVGELGMDDRRTGAQTQQQAEVRQR